MENKEYAKIYFVIRIIFIKIIYKGYDYKNNPYNTKYS